VRRRRQAQPARQHHPDPAVELQLQQIHGLLARIEQKAGLIGDYRTEIAELHDDIRWLARVRPAGAEAAAKAHDARIARLQQEIRGIDSEVDTAREQIAKLQHDMNPNDLAYLWN
jgi:chromosome segregation ATPase